MNSTCKTKKRSTTSTPTKVTIKTVAERAGVSTATVSRALNGHRNVAPELQASVARAAEALGYSINEVAIALRSSRTNTVGMIVPEIHNPLMSRLIHEVEYVLGPIGVQLMLCSSRRDTQRELMALKSLVAKRVDGLVIFADDRFAGQASFQGIAGQIPIIYVRETNSGYAIDSMGVKYEAAMRFIADHLNPVEKREAR